MYVVAEHYEAERDVQYHAEQIRKICAELNWHTDKFGRVEALMDSAANQRTLNGQKSVAELFAEEGLNVNTRVNKDVYTGMKQGQSHAETPCGRTETVHFCKLCKHLVGK